MPTCTILAGPNGAGKSTAAPELIRTLFGTDEFVNADVIAQGLAGGSSRSVSIRAGRLMVERLRQLADSGQDFAFETNLSSRSMAPFIRKLRTRGYRVNLYFFALPSAAHARARVALRVAQGGHFVPDDVVARRFESGRRLFFELYRDLVDEWEVLDGNVSPPEIIASGGMGVPELVDSPEKWKDFSTP
jgi:predicted ABC-type ATPase